MNEMEFREIALENRIPEDILEENIKIIYKLKEKHPDLTFESYLEVMIKVQKEPEMILGVD